MTSFHTTSHLGNRKINEIEKDVFFFAIYMRDTYLGFLNSTYIRDRSLIISLSGNRASVRTARRLPVAADESFEIHRASRRARVIRG